MIMVRCSCEESEAAALLTDKHDQFGCRLLGMYESSLVGQKDFARVQVAEAAQTLAANVESDHPAMGNQQHSKFGCTDNVSASRC
jgi:hypothetical protein